MSSRERRLLDKDKEIRKLKSTAGHYFNCTIDGAIKIYKLKKALDVAVDALKIIGSGEVIEHSVLFHEDDNKITIANKALDQINEITKELKDEEEKKN